MTRTFCDEVQAAFAWLERDTEFVLTECGEAGSFDNAEAVYVAVLLHLCTPGPW